MKFDEVQVDADILLYSVGFATQKSVYRVYVDEIGGDPIYVDTDKRGLNVKLALLTEQGINFSVHRYLYVQPFLAASSTLEYTLKNYRKKFETTNINLFLTGSDNFRDKIATIKPYKGNRSDAAKPHWYSKLKEYMMNKHSAILVEGQEADDALGIQQTKCTNEGKKSVIISIDKDLDMVQGYHYNPRRDELYFTDELQGHKFFYKQLLTGDRTDNIPGVKGIGNVNAAKLIDHLDDPVKMEELVFSKYKEVASSVLEAQAMMIEIGQLLWMRLNENEMWYPLSQGGCRVEI